MRLYVRKTDISPMYNGEVICNLKCNLKSRRRSSSATELYLSAYIKWSMMEISLMADTKKER